MEDSHEVIGLIPAAGYANRISPLPCSKEIYPVKAHDGGIQTACSYLLKSLSMANIDQAYMILRTGKWDIPAYLKDGSDFGLNLAYLVTEGTNGVPQTVDKAHSFIKNKKVAFGFPDILFHPTNAFNQLLDKQGQTDADLVLGLYEAESPSKMDMVDFDDQGALKDIVVKPAQSGLIYTWFMAVWTPAISHLLHNYLKEYDQKKLAEQETDRNGELHIGDVFREAIREGYKTSYVKFTDNYLDIGTPEELEKASDY